MVNFLYIGVNGCIFCFFQALKVIKTSIDAKDTADAVAAPAIPNWGMSKKLRRALTPALATEHFSRKSESPDAIIL